MNKGCFIDRHPFAAGLIAIAGVSLWLSVTAVDWMEAREADCHRLHPSAHYDFESDSCIQPPPPKPECRRVMHWDQRFGPPTIGITCHAPGRLLPLSYPIPLPSANQKGL